MGTKKASVHRLRLPVQRGLRLSLLCGFFVLGAVVGHVMAQIAGADEELYRYLLAFSETARDTFPSSWIQAIAAYVRYPLLAFLLGFCAFAALAIPFLLALQGFVLSFSVSLLTASLGAGGIGVVLAAFGLRALLTVLCTLLLAVCSFDRAVAHDGNSIVRPAPVLGVSVILLTLGIILEQFLIPTVFLSALDRLS